jgi:hypothetical protein
MEIKQNQLEELSSKVQDLRQQALEAPVEEQGDQDFDEEMEDDLEDGQPVP